MKSNILRLLASLTLGMLIVYYFTAFSLWEFPVDVPGMHPSARFSLLFVATILGLLIYLIYYKEE